MSAPAGTQGALLDAMPRIIRSFIGEDELPLGALEPSIAACEPGFLRAVQNYRVLSPILLVENAPDSPYRYRVVDGLRRQYAAQKAGFTTINALLYNMNPVEADSSTVMLNEKRSTNPVAELEAIERVMSTALGAPEIEAATGIPKKVIDELLRLRLLAPWLRLEFNEYRLRLNVARAIVKSESLRAGTTQAKIVEFAQALKGKPLLLKHLDQFTDAKKQEKKDSQPAIPALAAAGLAQITLKRSELRAAQLSPAKLEAFLLAAGIQLEDDLKLPPVVNVEGESWIEPAPVEDEGPKAEAGETQSAVIAPVGDAPATLTTEPAPSDQAKYSADPNESDRAYLERLGVEFLMGEKRETVEGDAYYYTEEGTANLYATMFRKTGIKKADDFGMFSGYGLMQRTAIGPTAMEKLGKAGLVQMPYMSSWKVCKGFALHQYVTPKERQYEKPYKIVDIETRGKTPYFKFNQVAGDYECEKGTQEMIATKFAESMIGW